jgi:hypothetical protein
MNWEKDLEGTSRSPIEVLLQYLSGETEDKVQHNLNKITCVISETLTKHLPNVSPGCYRHTTLYMAADKKMDDK